MTKKENYYFLIKIYLIIWALCIILFYISSPSDAMGYSLIVFYFVLPIIIITFSDIISYYYTIKSIYTLPIFFGISFMLADYFTYSLAYMVYYKVFKIPSISAFLTGLILSFLGLGIGKLFKKFKRNKNGKM